MTTTQDHPFVTSIVEATRLLADAVIAEQALEDNRINVKLAAIDRIMAAGDNQFTDADYQLYLERQRDAVRTRILARGAYEAAIAAASLHAETKV